MEGSDASATPSPSESGLPSPGAGSAGSASWMKTTPVVFARRSTAADVPVTGSPSALGVRLASITPMLVKEVSVPLRSRTAVTSAVPPPLVARIVPRLVNVATSAPASNRIVVTSPPASLALAAVTKPVLVKRGVVTPAPKRKATASAS